MTTTTAMKTHKIFITPQKEWMYCLTYDDCCMSSSWTLLKSVSSNRVKARVK